MNVNRLRMFAGPNGSGKSTVKNVISNHLLGHYLNPDDIERQVGETGFYDVSTFGFKLVEKEVQFFFEQHPLSHKIALSTDWRQIQHTDQGHLLFQNVRFDSYTSAILTDFLRQKLIEHQQSFTFETVMSSKDKVDTLKKARDLGFRTYLYYVATEDPLINISRVKYRILTGGHSVPENKIIERYYRSLELLSEAVQHTNRAYIFDNSGSNQTWIAEITEGTDLELKTNSVPEWVFRYLLNKI